MSTKVSKILYSQNNLPGGGERFKNGNLRAKEILFGSSKSKQIVCILLYIDNMYVSHLKIKIRYKSFILNFENLKKI